MTDLSVKFVSTPRIKPQYIATWMVPDGTWPSGADRYVRQYACSLSSRKAWRYQTRRQRIALWRWFELRIERPVSPASPNP
jgi:hypothetical protein